MLKNVRSNNTSARGHRFAIVASRYNGRFVNSMLRAAAKTLRTAGASQVRTVRVPGAFEIPVAVSALAEQAEKPFSAIICLGVILRGETTHAQHIGEAVTQALMQIQVTRCIPVIHEVLLLENAAQAEARCIDARRNRGLEAALTAIEMAREMAKTRGAKRRNKQAAGEI